MKHQGSTSAAVRASAGLVTAPPPTPATSKDNPPHLAPPVVGPLPFSARQLRTTCSCRTCGRSCRKRRRHHHNAPHYVRSHPIDVSHDDDDDEAKPDIIGRRRGSWTRPGPENSATRDSRSLLFKITRAVSGDGDSGDGDAGFVAVKTWPDGDTTATQLPEARSELLAGSASRHSRADWRQLRFDFPEQLGRELAPSLPLKLQTKLQQEVQESGTPAEGAACAEAEMAYRDSVVSLRVLGWEALAWILKQQRKQQLRQQQRRHQQQRQQPQQQR